jgi:putative hemolysin
LARWTGRHKSFRWAWFCFVGKADSQGRRVALTFTSTSGTAGPLGFLHRFSRRRERDLAGLGPTLGRSGALEARLAVTNKDVRRAQKLRYRAFFGESGATPDPTARITRRDLCPFDDVSDHLIVVDRAFRHRDGSPRLVGVYRLLRQDVAERNFGFYSALEFDVDALIRRRPGTRFLEVGRACIAPSHRGRRVLELLWRGLWAYARHHDIDAIIGCASLPGADPAPHGAAIRALAEGGDPSWRIMPRRPCAGLPYDRSAAPPLDPRALIRGLPPLVKGYLRLGATFSPIPAVDPAFNTTDVFVAMPLSDIEPRYLQYFGVEEVPALLAA